jgi:hypothetical protein
MIPELRLPVIPTVNRSIGLLRLAFHYTSDVWNIRLAQILRRIHECLNGMQLTKGLAPLTGIFFLTARQRAAHGHSLTFLGELLQSALTKSRSENHELIATAFARHVLHPKEAPL